MEETMITYPRSSKDNVQVSIRTKKYIRVYSAKRNSSKDKTYKQPKGNDYNISINPQRNSHEVSKHSLRQNTIYNLQQTSKSLLYDIQKAESDKYELIRDISTYEHNFSKENCIFTSLNKLNSIARPLPDAAEIIKQTTSHESLFFEELKKGLTAFHSINPKLTIKTEDLIEDFKVKKVNSARLLSNVFQGVYMISGIYSIISLVSDKWLENLTFKVQTLKGWTFTLQMTQNMSNSFYSSAQLIQAVKTKLLPFLIFRIEKKIVTLHFDLLQGMKKYTYIIQLKGYELCNVVVNVKTLDQITFDVTSLQLSLNFDVPKNLMGIVEDSRKFAREIQKNLMFCNKKKALMWGKSEELFELVEAGSRLFDEDYVKSTMDFEHYNQLFAFEMPRFNAWVVCFEFKDRGFLRITCGKDCAEIDTKSKHFSFLHEMQSLCITKTPKTLSSSLELEAILVKLFPRLNRKF